MTTLEDIYKGRSLVSPEDEVSDDNIDPNDVMPVQCVSCPYRSDGQRLELEPEIQAALYQMILSQGNQRCHAPALQGKPETKICRGARDIQLRYFTTVGVLEEPTDKCWKETLQSLKQAKD